MTESPEATHPLAERFAEVRGEHGWARYVDDETLAVWLRPAATRRDDDGPEEPARS